MLCCCRLSVWAFVLISVSAALQGGEREANRTRAKQFTSAVSLIPFY